MADISQSVVGVHVTQAWQWLKLNDKIMTKTSIHRVLSHTVIRDHNKPKHIFIQLQFIAVIGL